MLAPPYLRAAVGLGLTGPYSRATAAGFYDPKAAEFSRYLLDQQEELAAEQMTGSGGSGPMGLATSDDDDYLTGGPSGSRLIRSRSCMLNPGAQGSKNYQPKQGTSGKKSESSAGKMGVAGGASWADNGAQGGRSTIG